MASSGTTHQPVLGNKILKVDSLGNTLYVSPSAATYGEILVAGDWQAGNDGDFIDYLIENMVKLYQELMVQNI